MNTRMLIAALIGAIASFLLGWVVFGMLLNPYYEANAVNYVGLYRSGSDMRLYGIFLSQLAMSGLLAFVFSRWSSVRTFGTGLAGGIIIGGLIALYIDLNMWSSMNLYPAKVFAVDVIVSTAFTGLIGGVVAVVLGWKKSA